MTIHQIPNTLSLDAFWMPFTANRQFKAEPRLIAFAEGMHYTTVDGRKVIDGSAGLWCVNAGHGRREIADAVARQLVTLDYAPSFQIGHPIAFVSPRSWRQSRQPDWTASSSPIPVRNRSTPRSRSRWPIIVRPVSRPAPG